MRPALWVRRRWQQPSGILGVNQLKITGSGNSLPSPSFSDSRMALSCNGQCSQYGQWSTIKNSRSQTIKNHWFWELLTKPPLIKGCLCQWSRTVSWNKASNRSSSMGVFDLQVAIDRLCKKSASFCRVFQYHCLTYSDLCIWWPSEGSLLGFLGHLNLWSSD